jgi:nucleotide-binding universal stress UspA family protein
VYSSPITKTEILYATDFCEPAQRAFACAKEIARRRGVFLRSIHVIDLSGQEIRQHTSFQSAHGAAHRALRTMRRELRLGGIREAATVITGGTCGQAIRDAALRYHSTLLVMGLHGDPGLKVPVFGGTVRRLLRNPPCPVLTVGLRGPAIERNGLVNVLVVTDTAPESLAAVEQAWPSELHGPSSVHFAVLPPADAAIGTVVADESQKEQAQKHVTSAHPTSAREVNYDEAAKTILAQAAAMQANLIVLGVNAGGYLDSLVTGSVTRAVIIKAPCPVLTVRAGSVDLPMYMGRRALTSADIQSAFARP